METKNTLEFEDLSRPRTSNEVGDNDGLLPVMESTGPPKMETSITPGYKTSSGQLTYIFTIVCALLAMFGYTKITTDNLNNVYTAVMTLITFAGPLIAGAWNLMNYTNSRGKIQSNAIWATSSVTQAHTLAGSGFSGGVLGKIVSGIKTGLDITKIVAPALPIPGGISKGIQIGGSIMDGITSHERQLTDDDIREAIQTLNNNDIALNAKFDQLLKQKLG